MRTRLSRAAGSPRLRKRTVAGIAAATASLAAVSPVFACTQVMGPLTLTPSSGPAGTTILSSATGLKPYPAQYDLFFGGTCMTFTGKLLKTITTNGKGGWTNVKLHIPANAKLGQHSLCGIEAYPSAGATATTHDSFTVT